MKNRSVILLSIIVALGLASLSFGQTPQLRKKTTYKTETIEFGAGGTLTVIGAPKGAIQIEGWQKNEVEIVGEIEIEAENEADLALLSQINTFIIDEGFGHVRVMSVGTHDRSMVKKLGKKLPKRLLSMPFKINYKIKVPMYCDLEVNGGVGDLKISNVDGAMQIKAVETNADLALTGGDINATIGTGNVDVKIGTRSWRGRHAEIRLATGTMNVQFPLNFNAHLDASILRVGKIESTVSSLKPRDRTKFSEKSMIAKAGNGGAYLTFTVGDGLLKMSNWQ